MVRKLKAIVTNDPSADGSLEHIAAICAETMLVEVVQESN
jgi:hypothetical protein